jgi:Trypsin
MRLARVALAVAMASCAYGQAHDEPIATTAESIQNGTPDATHTFEVGFCGGTPGDCHTFCSATLLAPNLVATARHCIADVPTLASDGLDCATTSFGAEDDPLGFYVTTNESMSDATGVWIQAAAFVTPATTLFCGGDLALVILASSVPASAATPATPNVLYDLRDRAHISTTETAIGYGVTSPTGTDVGERRVLEDIPFTCIPDDPDIDCYPQFQGAIAEAELYAGNGPCAGDSGSGALEQTSFDDGAFLALGALSRGGSSSDGATCEGSVYTRFDSYRDLVIQAANQAAAAGGYAAPSWVSAPPIAPFGDAGAIDAGEVRASGSSGCALGGAPAPFGWAFALAAAVALCKRRR